MCDKSIKKKTNPDIFQDNNLFNEVLDVFKGLSVTSTEPINENTNFNSLGFNSITYIKLIVKLEEKYQIEFDDQYLENNSFTTVGNLIDYLKSKKMVK